MPHATHTNMTLGVANGIGCLQILDDGNGFDPAAVSEGGFGLVHSRGRAEKMHGAFTFEIAATGGTTLVWQPPIS